MTHPLGWGLSCTRLPPISSVNCYFACALTVWVDRFQGNTYGYWCIIKDIDEECNREKLRGVKLPCLLVIPTSRNFHMSSCLKTSWTLPFLFFMEVLFHRHDWLNHCSLVTSLTFSSCSEVGGERLRISTPVILPWYFSDQLLSWGHLGAASLQSLEYKNLLLWRFQGF